MASIHCERCGYAKSDGFRANLVGKRVKCPKCRRAVTVMANDSRVPIDFPMDDEKASSPLHMAVSQPAGRSQPNVFRPPVKTPPPSKDSTTTLPTVVSPRIVPGNTLLITDGVLHPQKHRRKPVVGWIVASCLAAASFVAGALSSKHLFPVRFSAAQPEARQPHVAAQPKAVDTDKVLAMVRDYLEENTNSGEWEEIRHWPGFTISTPLQFQALDQARVNGLVSGWDARILFDDPTIHFTRLKYRTNNVFGHPTVSDDVFGIQQGKLIHVTAYEAALLQDAWESLEAASR